ncbi:MAG: fibronectin type III domain-containing protein [Nitrospira sp.]|nr:fibronectin type III domain-containing protein [Nitrospira sp.]
MLEHASPVGFLYRQVTRSIGGLIIAGVIALPLTGCSNTEGGGGPIVSSLSSPTEDISSAEGGTESGVDTVDTNVPSLSEDENPSVDLTENEAEDPETLANVESPDQEQEDPAISLTSTPTGVTARLTWDASTDPNVAGYNVYYGKQSSGEFGSCSYEEGQAVENPPAVISGLDPNTPYFFAISAYGGEGGELESPCSNEVLVVTPPAQS